MWLEMARKFEAENILSSEVIACDVMLDRFDVNEATDEENLNDNIINVHTFEVMTSFVSAWLGDTEISWNLGYDVVLNLKHGLLENAFTVDNIEHDYNDKVKDYINSKI